MDGGGVGVDISDEVDRVTEEGYGSSESCTSVTPLTIVVMRPPGTPARTGRQSSVTKDSESLTNQSSRPRTTKGKTRRCVWAIPPPLVSSRPPEASVSIDSDLVQHPKGGTSTERGVRAGSCQTASGTSRRSLWRGGREGGKGRWM